MPFIRRNFLIILLLAVLLISAHAIKPNHDPSGAQALRIINSMLRSNSLPETKQIGHCLTPEEANNILAVITKLNNVAAEAGTTELKNFPIYYLNYTQTTFSKATLSCIYKSRDFQLLLSNYGTDFDKMGAAFTRIVDKSYLIVHKSFTELRSKLLQGLYEDYGLRLDLMFKDYFGLVVKKEKEWVKSVSNLQNFDGREYYGITVSNGVIGAVSSIRPISVATTVLGGAYDVFGRGRVDSIVETFPALQVEINVGGSDITGSGYYNYEQGLHFRSGQFFGEYSHERCSVKYSYMALKNLPFAFYTSVEIVAHETTTLSALLRHKAPQYLNDIQKSYENLAGLSIMHTKATTKTGKLELVIASSFTQQEGTQYTFSHEDWDSNNHFMRTSINITKGQVYRLGFISSLISTAHHEDPVNEALRIVERGVLVGEQTLIIAHRALWEKLWASDIVIEGHDEDQKNVRLMLYHCYAFINDFKSYGISPMGLSGLGYNGHVFWDMDLWIYPGILGLNPSLAKTLIEYRIQRLEAARNNAFINGYKGAMFPWESSKLGIEETPVWALTGPLEHHISGCVAFAVWNYFAVTQDEQWLEEKGFPVLAAVAQFWQSRVVKGDDGYHINNVVAADQWAENVDDNAFTNAVAKQSLRLYNLAAKRLNLTQNKKYAEISEGIIILKLDNNVTKEHRTYHGENIKQADVNLLSYPLKTITDIEQVKRDLSYYQRRIPDQGTPAMTYSIFTILYSRLMDSDSAYKYFKQSHQSYLKKPFNVIAETKWGTNPYFLTGAGGVIQSLVFGFGGYDITDKGIQRIKTAIPKEWKSVTIKGFLNENLTLTTTV